MAKTSSDEYFNRLPPFLANEKNEGRNRWHWRFDTPERYQEYMKNYYRLASEVDATCGLRNRKPMHNDANLIRRRNWGKVFRSFGIFGGLCLLVQGFSRNFQKFA